jgi:hypothetical protein
MKQSIIILVSLLVLASCAKDKYSPSAYYTKPQQDSVLANIITYIFSAPPYTAMKDRFQAQHRKYYTSDGVISLFSMKKFYVNQSKGINYFLVIRPGASTQQKRGVGGYFKSDDGKITGFREVFVTPVMSEQEVNDKGAFLFDKMVTGEIDEYLKMKTYVQWPNEASMYDTVIYEWKLIGQQ